MSIFKNPSNYFFTISFDWKDIYNVLEIPQEEQAGFIISDNYYYRSLNGNDGNGLGIDAQSVIFEYYIMPSTLRNSVYSYSSIFDQQTKRFSETPNINYGPLLKSSIEKDSNVIFLFGSNVVDGKAGFSLHFTKESNSKAIVFLFDKKYLNLGDADTSWGKEIPFETYKVSYLYEGEPVIKEIPMNSTNVNFGVSVQSKDDAQTSPISHILHNYLKNKLK